MANGLTSHRRELLILLLGVLVALCIHNAEAQKRPPNYSQNDMPVTSFNCRDKIVGGYYADPETDCQMFHVCVHYPGTGIQDFRFLCPNDTSFDQEHQICDDWYNIDCAISSAYYGENFDLYRIGVSHADDKKPSVSAKGTPIPLGPSTTIKSNQQTKKNQYSNEEDDYKYSGNDILRGSHSSNYFANKNRGREDLENSYVTSANVGAQRQHLSSSKDIKKQKTLVRKLAGKRPVTQKSTTFSPETAAHPTQPSQTPQQVPAFNYNQNYNQPYQPYQGNKVNKSRGNINYNTYSTKASQSILTSTSPPNIYQKINNLTEIDNRDSSPENAATSVLGEVSKTHKHSYSIRHPSSNYNTPKQTLLSRTTVTTNSYTEKPRLLSAEYLQNIVNTYQQPAAVINNQLQKTGKSTYPQQIPYDQYRQPQAATESTFASYDQYQEQYQWQPSTNFNAPQTPSAQVYYNPSSPAQSDDLYQIYTTPVSSTDFDYYKYYRTSTSAPAIQKARFHSDAPAFNFYTHPSTTNAPKYDPYATFQKANEKYDEEEFLKTAHSSNLKPSDLNAIYNQKKQLYINATLKAAYSAEQPKSSYVQHAETSNTLKTIPSKVGLSHYTNLNPVKSTSQYKSPIVVPSLTQSPRPSSSLNATSSNSHDYDYAYYDNTGVSDYDQLENVEEDFVKLDKKIIQKT